MNLSKFAISNRKLVHCFYDYNIIRFSSTLVHSPVSVEALDKAKPFDEIPGPKAFPFIGSVYNYLPGIGNYSLNRWHEAQRKKFYMYGPIVREIFLGIPMVQIYTPKDFEAVAKHEGIYPHRDFFVSMKMMRERKSHIFKTVGVVAGNGETWYQDRTKFQKVLMRPPVIKQCLPQINEIAEELIGKIRYLRTNELQVPGLKQELFKWALESVIFILFSQRFGCLAKDLPKNSKAVQFIQAVNEFFTLTGNIELSLLPFWRFFPKLSPSFKKLEKVHAFCFESAMEYAKDGIEQVRSKKSSSLMEQLLNFCAPEEAAVMAVDAMAAGIDTTALSMAYVLRHLAANPDVQKKLQKEIDDVMPNGSPMTSDIMEKIPYLRACIKESMRLTPVVNGTSRKLNKDIVLSGYRIPKDTTINLNYFVSSVQEENYPEPLKYIPERWLRSDSKSVESFAFQPFGFGPRMCIGRRIAEVEMFTLLSKIVQNFWIENKDQTLDIEFQLVLMIKNQLKYEFHER